MTPCVSLVTGRSELTPLIPGEPLVTGLGMGGCVRDQVKVEEVSESGAVVYLKYARWAHSHIIKEDGRR